MYMWDTGVLLHIPDDKHRRELKNAVKLILDCDEDRQRTSSQHSVCKKHWPWREIGFAALFMPRRSLSTGMSFMGTAGL